MHRLGLRWSATQTSVGAGLEGNRYFTKTQAWWATKISPKAVRIDFEVENHFSEPWPALARLSRGCSFNFVPLSFDLQKDP